MTITRNIKGEDIQIELTEKELLEASYDYDMLCALEDLPAAWGMEQWNLEQATGVATKPFPFAPESPAMKIAVNRYIKYNRDNDEWRANAMQAIYDAFCLKDTATIHYV